MKRPTQRTAIAAYCRECNHDPDAAGTWREQAAICQCADCPLWRFRPLPRNAPTWIASREPGDLPDGFHRLPHYEAIRQMRGNMVGKASDGADFHAPQTQANAGATGVTGSSTSVHRRALHVTERTA